MPRHRTSEHMLERARALRNSSSPPERVLWARLRDRRLCGLKFRRQQAIGRYVADFVCARRRLIVEIDGRHHEARAERDEARDAYLRKEGWRVLRIPVSDVTKNLESVLERIMHECGALSPRRGERDKG